MSSDTLRIMCPSLTCRRVLAVPVSSRGKNVRCKSCGATIRVPEKAVVAAPVAKKGIEVAAKDGDAGAAKAA